MRKAGVALITMAALAAATGARAQEGVPLVNAVPTISVTGEAKRDVAPDIALVRIGVVTDRETAAQAAKDNAQAATALVAAARGAGLPDVDIQTSDLGLAAMTDDKDASRIRAYRANDIVTLRLHDLRRVGSLVGQLMANGANSLEGIEFAVDKPQPILDDLAAEATQDAARKAGIYARAASVKLGRVLRIMPLVDGPMPMARAFKTQMADGAGGPPVEGGTQQLRARVEITWELAP